MTKINTRQKNVFLDVFMTFGCCSSFRIDFYMAKEKPIGLVTHYYDKIGVAIVKFNRGIKVGETIHFKGSHTDFVQKIDSIQRDHKDIKSAKKGQEVGIKVEQKTREGDKVYEA